MTKYNDDTQQMLQRHRAKSDGTKTRNSGLITIAEMGRLLKKRRTEAGLNTAEVALETGVVKSTISRIENGKTADASTIIKITQWLGIPAQRIQNGQFVCFANEPTPQVVDALIRTDPNLTPAAQEALSAIFEAAYKAVVREHKAGH